MRFAHSVSPFAVACSLTIYYYRITKISDKYSWSEICSFTEEDMTKLLSYYTSGTVPPLAELRPGQEIENADVFDGSFGFSVGS